MNRDYISRMPSSVGIPLQKFSVRRGKEVIHLRNDDTGAEYEWPYVTRSEQRFTVHLLNKLFNDDVVSAIILRRETVWTILPPNLFGGYLPPEYRAVITRQSLWNRFIKLFEKENHHARNQHNQSAE